MITLTEQAVEQIKRLQSEEKVPHGGLRIGVAGGGCSGLSYKLDFANAPEPEDKIFEQQGVKIFIDQKSYLYLKGLQLDYSGGLNGTGFSFRNPNATRSCGCGSSFSV